jgi:hypothetical protein
MKNRTKSATILITLLLSVLACLLGCATTGIERSEKTTTTMQTVADEISQVAEQLDVTAASMDELTKWGQPDVKKAFDAFSVNVVKMDNLEKQLSKHADEMKSRGKEYFAEWKKQGDGYANPQIRELSEQRRAALGQVYDKIAKASIGVKSAFRAYMSDLTEIQTYLSNDLTQKGITSITPISERVVRDGDSLKNSVTGVQTAIDDANAEMSQH